MLSVLKLFFSGPSGWVTILGVVALLFGVYTLGHSQGHTSGYESGFTAGQKSRDVEVGHLNDNVKALTDIVNKQRTAQAEKVADVQKAAADDAVKTQKVMGQQIRQRDAIIQSYRDTVSKEIQNRCALSIETVKAINLLIDNANEDPDEGPNENPPDLSTVPADNTSVGGNSSGPQQPTDHNPIH